MTQNQRNKTPRQRFCPLTRKACRADCMWHDGEKCMAMVIADELFVLVECELKKYPPPPDKAK